MTTSHKHSKDIILIIEDDAATRNATARFLHNAGYSVASVKNGLEAMHYLHSHPLPRLILLDLNMPVMDGWQFRTRQEQDPALNRIPVVLLSSEDNLEEAADALHADHCLHKPVEAQELLDTIRS